MMDSKEYLRGWADMETIMIDIVRARIEHLRSLKVFPTAPILELEGILREFEFRKGERNDFKKDDKQKTN